MVMRATGHPWAGRRAGLHRLRDRRCPEPARMTPHRTDGGREKGRRKLIGGRAVLVPPVGSKLMVGQLCASTTANVVSPFKLIVVPSRLLAAARR